MLSNEFINSLNNTAGSLMFFTGEAIGADYCHDECPGVSGTPDAVVEVTSTEQAAAVVKLCDEAGVLAAAVEQDICPADPVDSLEISYKNLTKLGFN